jgi:hypothetical protein
MEWMYIREDRTSTLDNDTFQPGFADMVQLA